MTARIRRQTRRPRCLACNTTITYEQVKQYPAKPGIPGRSVHIIFCARCDAVLLTWEEQTKQKGE